MCVIDQRTVPHNFIIIKASFWDSFKNRAVSGSPFESVYQLLSNRIPSQMWKVTCNRLGPLIAGKVGNVASLVQSELNNIAHGIAIFCKYMRYSLYS